MSMTAPAPDVSVEAAKPLVAVKGLGRIFDVSKPWLNRVTEAPAAPPAHRRRRRDVLDRQARDLRAGRRIRLRQVDGRQDGGRTHPADHRRSHHRRRVDERPQRRRRAAALAPPHPDDLPGPLREPQPALARARHHRRAAARLRHREGRPRDRPAGRRPVEARRPRSGGRREIPARVLRRPAPAHRDRARACLQSRVHRLRRADLGARRLGAGADPQPDARPAGPLRPDLSASSATIWRWCATWRTASA